MNSRLLPAAFSLCLAVCQAAVSAQQATDSAELLTVMLQGSSASELRQLVEAHGGTVSHELHIIDAVGASLSSAQLEEILKSSLVSRHISDLSLSTAPDKKPGEAVDNCEVGGALELEFTGQGISWTLFNKLQQAAKLQRLELAWPGSLGPVDQIALGGKLMAPRLLQSQADGALTLEFKETVAPRLSGISELQIMFSAMPGTVNGKLVRQRDFRIKAGFYGDCSTELIPGYEDNHENFHYASVAGADSLHLHGVTGKGVTVAVLDSGLWEQPALAKDSGGNYRVIARYDAITDTTGKEVFDESGHGTHMTSIIAQSGPVTRESKPTGSFKGVAPDVSLVAVKAFDVAGQGDFLDIVRAVQWIVDNREVYSIRVLNLSFAARPRWPYWLDPINQAIMRAWNSGITVVAAAGNEGPEPMTIGSPGNLPYVITVGAVTDSWTPDDRDDDYIPDFSSRGPTPSAHIKPDLVAPGGHITGLTRPGSTLTLEHPEYLLSTGEFVMTGSSQASALVSGIAALLLQLEPELAPDDVKCKLITSAEPAINEDGLLAYSPFQQGFGYVNATRAVTLGERGCGNPDMDILADMAGKKHFQGPAIVEEDGQVSLPGLKNMVSPDPSARGLSKTRKWGIKAHIERETSATAAGDPNTQAPFDWHKLYLEEKTAIENLASQRPE